MNSRWGILVLPILGLLLFASESYRSFRYQQRALTQEDACFCWLFLPLDSKPLNKSYEMFGVRNLTSCGALRELNARTDAGCGRSSLPTRLLTISVLPAFLASLGIVRGLAKLGVNEVVAFMATTPPLIFVWYYFLTRVIARLISRRQEHELATSH